MHYLSISVLLITTFIISNARLSLSNSLPNNYRSCPEQYRELRRRNDETVLELNDNDDDNDADETREAVCEQAMDIIVRHPNIAQLKPSILLNNCPHYDERLALAQENNNTLCEIKKQELNMKRKRDDNISDSDDNDDDDKRRALYRRKLKKRFALRFLRRQMS